LKLGRGASGILISPHGSRAFVAISGEDAVAVIDLRTLTETTRLKTGRGPDGMAWLEAKR
jgi:YVTN family beta-propeller protein